MYKKSPFPNQDGRFKRETLVQQKKAASASFKLDIPSLSSSTTFGSSQSAPAATKRTPGNQVPI